MRAEQTTAASKPVTLHAMRLRDLVPLRRMLGPHAMVIRVGNDGSTVPLEVLPELLADRSITRVLKGDKTADFNRACAQVIDALVPSTFAFEDIELVITPVLDDADRCRFLVCWIRVERPVGANDALSWADLDVAQIEVEYRSDGVGVSEAEPCWRPDGRDTVALWPSAEEIAGVGSAPSVIASVLGTVLLDLRNERIDAEHVRIVVPRAEYLSGLGTIAHGLLRRTPDVDAASVILALPVELAVDPDLLPVIVHLRTMGFHIEMVGLDQLTQTLRMIHGVPGTSGA